MFAATSFNMGHCEVLEDNKRDFADREVLLIPDFCQSSPSTRTRLARQPRSARRLRVPPTLAPVETWSPHFQRRMYQQPYSVQRPRFERRGDLVRQYGSVAGDRTKNQGVVKMRRTILILSLAVALAAALASSSPGEYARLSANIRTVRPRQGRRWGGEAGLPPP